jgi:peroxiredoxin
MMLLLAMLLAALPVRPVADAPRLAAEIGHGRPAVLHFWATWCGACVEEFPRLRKELRALQGRGVAVALISIDAPADAGKAERFLQRYQLAGLPALLLDAPDPDPVAKAVGDPRWDGTLPSTFVFDSSGKLFRSFIGQTKPSALEAAVKQVR